MLGRSIGQYEIIEKIGEGGMGVVYKARDSRLDRNVALKFLPPRLAASAQDKARFIQEARAASSLNHPNVCTIYDIQEHDGQLFIVMEFVDGTTLQEKLSSLSVTQGIDIGIQVADGLAAAHEKGIVHRDIKPENIMVRRDGIAQIMDFGLAKLRGATRLTRETSTVGTARYMSPELVQGQDADHRSDIFSLGVLLYEIFTRQHPFKGVHESAVMYEIVNVDPAPMTAMTPGIDPQLEAVVFDCLEKDAKERCQSVAEVSRALRRIKRDSSRQHMSRIAPPRPARGPDVPEGPRPDRMPRVTRMFWPILSLVMGVMILLLGWMQLRTAGQQKQPIRLSMVIPKSDASSSQYNLGIALSPDGTRFIYRMGDQLYRRDIGNFTSEPIAGTEGGINPFFSPDGNWVGFYSDARLKRVSLTGGMQLDVSPEMGNRGAVWTRDRRIIFTPTARAGLVICNEDGTNRRQITSIDSSKNERTHRYPQLLPDGRHVLFTIGTMDSPDYYEDASIGVVDMETGERAVLLQGASTAIYLPTGHLLYSHAGTLFVVPFDANRLEVTGNPIPVQDNVNGDPVTGASSYAVAENGTLAYVPGNSGHFNRTLALIDRDGNSTTLPVPPQPYLEPRVSPDGKRLAVVISSPKGYDIWIGDMAGHNLNRLTFGGFNHSPAWSPDSRRIAYSLNTPGSPKIIIRAADGSGNPDEIATDYEHTYIMGWTRDASSLLFTGIRNASGGDILLLPLTGDRRSRPLLNSRFDESNAAISPDGRWLAYISNESGTDQVYVRPFPQGSGKWQISPDGGFGFTWSTDGRTLFYQSQSELRAVAIDGSRSLVVGATRVVSKNVLRFLVESRICFDPMPDGKHLLYSRPTGDGDANQQINVVLNWFDEFQHMTGTRK